MLDRQAGARAFRHGQLAPSGALAPFVAHYWSVRWELEGRPPFTSSVLSHPAVHVAFQEGASGLFGVVRGRFTRTLEGRGRVFGVKFHPGAFRPFIPFPVAELTDRVRPLSALPGLEGEAAAALEAAVLAEEEDAGRAALVERWLLAHLPPPDPEAARARRLVERILREPALTRVEALVATEPGLSLRSLQRLFREYVGVPPKWVLRRARLHEAAERLEGGAGGSLAALAVELGYFDQAHFTREFTAVVGRPPSAYARGARR
jgi:AraC-like DNA-binding protein